MGALGICLSLSHANCFLLATIFYRHDHQVLKGEKIACCVYLLRTYMEVFYLFFYTFISNLNTDDNTILVLE